MTQDEIIKIQEQLVKAGWPVEIDGIYGPATAEAYQAWLNANTPADMPTPAPPAPKPWYLSRTIIGILVSVIAVIAERMGWMVDSNDLTVLVMQLLEVGGLALAFIGTVRRRAPIDGGLIVRGVRYANTTYPVPPDRPTDRPTGPFGF